MAGKNLITITEECDLGVIINNDLKSSKHCSSAAKKANRMLEMISRTVSYKTKFNVLKLYNAFVRPHLEYAVQFWSPYLRKDINKLEKVQRRATKLIPSLRNKSYENRLRELNLYSLEKRRLRGDMIEVWKIMKGKENINRGSLFTIEEHGVTRSNGFKIIGKRFNTEIARNFFTYRVVNEWNKIPYNVINCETLDTFKKRLDKYYADRRIL